MPLDASGYALSLAAALLVGLSKTGVPGVALPAILMMTRAFAGNEKLSVGAMLPLLLVGDVLAVACYRRHAQWDRLLGLFPAVLAGMVPAVAVLHLADDRVFKLILGWMILGLLVLEGLRRWQRVRAVTPARDDGDGAQRAGPPERRATDAPAGSAGRRPLGPRITSAAMGLLAGFGTMLGNAAGPVMTIFLVGRGLDKQQFMGTWAWFFLIVNAIKVPVYPQLGLLTDETLRFGLMLAPAVAVGALAGRRVFAVIPQRVFDLLVLAFAAVAALQLVAGD